MKITDRKAEAVRETVRRLQETGNSRFNAVLGFDACIDNIIRVIKGKGENNNIEFFSNSREFGEYLIKHENISCGIELKTIVSKIGGNMVIMGNALGNLGVKSDCIGTFGFPEILPFFRSMSPNCTLHTVGETITASALEFSDSKIIMFDPGPYVNIDWEEIKNKLGTEQITRLFSGKQLIALLNWSELEKSSLIWKGIYEEIFPALKSGAKLPVLFADLADCSRRPASEIQSVVSRLAQFTKYSKVILSLNQNEASVLAKAMNVPDAGQDEGFIRKLFNASNVSELVIHRTKDALAFNGERFEECGTFLCEDPVILTGGGDNFNAGYCFAALIGCDLFQSLLIGNAVSGYYVRNGKSPDTGRLVDFLKLFNE